MCIRDSYNSGQCCCGIERIYVHESQYDAFVDGFQALTSQYVLGNPLDEATTLGPMAQSKTADIVRAQTAQALSKGAKALIDTSKFKADIGSGTYLCLLYTSCVSIILVILLKS